MDGEHFALTKVLKEFLVYGHHESRLVALKSRVGRHLMQFEGE